MGRAYLRYTVGTLKYRQFFSMLALASGAATSLGLVLSLPTTFSVEIAEAALPVTHPSILALLAASSTLSTLPVVATTPLSTIESLTLPTTTTAQPDTISALTKKESGEETTTPRGLSKTGAIFLVPFYSQLTDITAPAWKKVACGITSLAMLIEYYHPNKIASVDTLLDEGIAVGAYNDSVGWSYNGLIAVAKKYGLDGSTHDYKDSSMDVAFQAFSDDLKKGPIMASVHYTFKASNPIPHLVIVNGIKNGLVYYNDPAATTGGGSITITQFKEGWKKRYIEFYTTA
jgi:uncharacterized protein YvpB